MKKIKSITGYTSYVIEDDMPVDEYKSSYKELDHNQNIIKVIIYNADGEIEDATGYQFDDSGKLIKEMYYIDDYELSEMVNYKYSYGELSEIEMIFSDGSKSVKKIRKNGNIVTIITRDENNRLEAEEIRTLDDKDNVIEKLIYNDKKEIEQKLSYTYDNNGNVTVSTEYGKDESFVLKKTFDYDEYGNMIKESHYTEWDAMKEIFIFRYNKKGDLISQQEGNKYLVKILHDEWGRLIKEEKINLSNGISESITSYKYGVEDYVIEQVSYDIGEQYSLNPGVLTRTGSEYKRIKYHYEFY